MTIEQELSEYRGPFWAFILPNGMPHEIRKCTFAPTISPSGVVGGDWVELYKPHKFEPTKKEKLKSLIRGHMEAMRPLLAEWNSDES